MLSITSIIHGTSMFCMYSCHVLPQPAPYLCISHARFTVKIVTVAKIHMEIKKHGIQHTNINGSTDSLKHMIYKHICNANKYERKNKIAKHRYDKRKCADANVSKTNIAKYVISSTKKKPKILFLSAINKNTLVWCECK